MLQLGKGALVMREFGPNDTFLLYAPGAGSGLPDVAARHDGYLSDAEREAPSEPKGSPLHSSGAQ